jgi:ParB/RepB/Spo0J family partition protein
MSKSAPKVALSASRDIPFNRLVLSQANVRRIKAGIAVEELAEDIARRTLLQSLTVRPVLDDNGHETGMFEVPSGGRRFRALELLVKQKRLARTAPIPCVIRTEGIAEEDSLAENVQRAPLHPLDQFRAFQALRERGRSEEEIAAAFFVSASVVRQRLRLAAVSPRLLGLYAEDGMTLDQLMAFTVSPDHERQEQVWEALQRSYTKEPYQIRRLLTEGTVRAPDKRARFVGADDLSPISHPRQGRAVGLNDPSPIVGAPEGRVSGPSSRWRAGCATAVLQRNRRLIADRPVRAFLVVVSAPSLQLFLRVSKRQEPVRVQALCPDAPVESLGEGIVRRLAGP